ncbi:MAG: hypothetical protein GX174_11625 [Lentisphaerae bacterium]|jgi:hypothetical protein|nr:hypothetical protein [Lentisphaerota bacterium]
MNNADKAPAMAPDLQASLLCDDVRQERNGKFILIGIFEGLLAPSFPAVFHRLCLVNRWCSGEGEFHQLSRIVSADGKTTLAEGRPVPVRLADVTKVATSVEYFVNVRIPEAGDYWVEILLDQQLRLRYPLHVRKHNEGT